MSTSIEDLFNGENDAVPEESKEVKETEPEEIKSKGDKPTTETSEPTGEKPESKDTSPVSEATVPITALHGERDRRQAAERELETLRNQQPAEEPKPLTSVFESEDGFVSDLERKFSDQLVNRTLNESQFHAEQKYGAEALAAKVETFRQLAADNPHYAREFSESVSPYFTLVKLVDQHDELGAMKDIDSYKARLKAEAKVEALKEIEADQKGKEDLKSSIPESLVGDTSKGGLTGSEWSGPASTESVFD